MNVADAVMNAPQRRRGRKGAALVGILVVTEDEWNAANRIFPSLKRIDHTPYYSLDPSRPDDVVLRKLPDRGNLYAHSTTRELIEDYSPSFIFLFGTAGGVSRDGVKLGDVVVANYVEYAAFKKIVSAAAVVWPLSLFFKPKTIHLYRTTPMDHPSLYLRDDLGMSRREPSSAWRGSIGARRPDTLDLGLHFGQILCNEAILSAPNSEEVRAALARFDKALAVETEAQGLATAVYCARKDPHYNPLYLIVRGISDMIDGGHAENERKAWSDYAAEAAGRLVAHIVEELLEIYGAP